MQTQTFIELASFEDFTRYCCAFREFPLRVYSHMLESKRVLSTGISLTNSVLFFYTQMPKKGSYLSYSSNDGKEKCDIVDSTKNISTYSPIIHLESNLTPLQTTYQEPADLFSPIKLSDLGSLSRLTYDPMLQDASNLSLFLFKKEDGWILGYVTTLEMNEPVFVFNYVELQQEPDSPFLKYNASEGKEPEFTRIFDHGYAYLPIIRLKENHIIFGLV